MYCAGEEIVGSTLQDKTHAIRLNNSFAAILEDYEQGRAQTPHERLIAEALSWVEAGSRGAHRERFAGETAGDP